MTQPSDPAGSAHLEIAVSVEADTAAIRVRGVLDAVGGERLRAAVDGLPQRLRRVEIDLSGVTAADLAGVRALDELRGLIHDSGAELLISNADLAAYPTDWHVVPRTREQRTTEGKPDRI